MLGGAYVVGRVLLAILFIVEGTKKVFNIAATANYIASAKIPIPDEVVPYLYGIPKYEAAAYLVAAVEIVCGLLILAGFAARWGALILVVFTAAATFYFHNFWEMSGELAAQNQVHALKNLAILGGLLLIVAGGARLEAVRRPQQP